MTGKDFFELEARGETFAITLKASCHGFKRGDVVICRKASIPLPQAAIAILERDDCERWPMPYGDICPELAAGARVIGQALALSRDLDKGARP